MLENTIDTRDGEGLSTTAAAAEGVHTGGRMAGRPNEGRPNQHIRHSFAESPGTTRYPFDRLRSPHSNLFIRRPPLLRPGAIRRMSTGLPLFDRSLVVSVGSHPFAPCISFDYPHSDHHTHWSLIRPAMHSWPRTKAKPIRHPHTPSKASFGHPH
ncbi:hypothetical protein E3N88_04284 [Mikania micrantha]|uniref:Uncharacterized protein n=1 Tax=Mikania micrantha TaxID=192012 RepID=A0A5N6PVV5_9ASTR|nr:hypothetical protein E3N88_04284 [Mikania micrantha]